MSDEITIHKGRLDELLQAEKRLICLESAGVDNWDGYDDALEDYYKECETKQIIDDWVAKVVDELDDMLVGNIEEPAGAGCGYGITKNGYDEIAKIIRKIAETKIDWKIAE